MRIGLISGEYPPMQGGVGAYSQIIAQALAERGHDVFVFSDAQAQDAHVHMTATATHWNILTLRRIRQWAQAHRLDVVNLQFETAAYGMSPFIHFLPEVMGKIPLVTSFHDLLVPYLFPKAGPIRPWIVMRLARASDGVIVTNHADYAKVKHLQNTALIPIGSNVQPQLPADYDRAAWRDRAGATSDDLLLAHFGFINHSKGLETLLRAASLLRAENIPIKLVMIGGRTGASDPTNAAYADEIDTLIHKLNLQAHLCWTGFVDDAEVSGYLAAADGVVLPFRDGASYRRGSLMAAIRHGCAIITTQPQVDIPTFKHSENMLLFPPGDLDRLQQHIRELQTGQHSHIQAGADALAAHFDWSTITDACLAMYEQVRM